MRKRLLLAICISAAIEAAVIATYFLFGNIGPDGPNAIGFITIFILHYVGVIIADAIRIGGFLDTMVIAATGFVQYTLIAFCVISFIERKKNANETYCH